MAPEIETCPTYRHASARAGELARNLRKTMLVQRRGDAWIVLVAPSNLKPHEEDELRAYEEEQPEIGEGGWTDLESEEEFIRDSLEPLAAEFAYERECYALAESDGWFYADSSDWFYSS